MSKRKFTHDELIRAIDLALANGEEAEGRCKGMVDLSTELLEMIQRAEGSDRYGSDGERLVFIKEYLKHIWRYNSLKLETIEQYKSLGITEELLKEATK